jgi:hypothetical protein
MLAGNLAAADEIEPSVQDLWRLVEQPELVSKRPDYPSRYLGGPAQAVGRLRTSRHGPELHKNLSSDEDRAPGCNQTPYGGFRDGALSAFRIRQSQQYVRIEEPTHQS